MGSEIALGSSAVGYCRDNSTISQYVHVPAISRAPLQLHLMFVSLRLQARLEHDVSATAGRQFEIGDARAPVKAARGVVVLGRKPEGLVVDRVHRHVAVVTPATGGGDLRTRAIKNMAFALRHGIDRIGPEATCVADLRVDS